MTTASEAHDIAVELMNNHDDATAWLGSWNELLLFLSDLPEETESGLGPGDKNPAENAIQEA